MNAHYVPPSVIEGVAVISTNTDILPSGEWIVTIIAEHLEDPREWEFSLTHGSLTLKRWQ
jgi:hypothetical protein